MTNYASWRPIHRAMCPEPGPRDLFVVILINGKRVNVQPVADYARWRTAAERLAQEHKCQVKVLPMTGEEVLNLLGIAPAAPQPLETMVACTRPFGHRRSRTAWTPSGSPMTRAYGRRRLICWSPWERCNEC